MCSLCGLHGFLFQACARLHGVDIRMISHRHEHSWRCSVEWPSRFHTGTGKDRRIFHLVPCDWTWEVWGVCLLSRRWVSCEAQEHGLISQWLGKVMILRLLVRMKSLKSGKRRTSLCLLEPRVKTSPAGSHSHSLNHSVNHSVIFLLPSPWSFQMET